MQENEVWITRVRYLVSPKGLRSGVVVGTRNIAKHLAMIDGERVLVPAEKGYQVYTDTGCWDTVPESKVIDFTHALL